MNLCQRKIQYICPPGQYENKALEKCEFYEYDNIGEPYRVTCYHRRGKKCCNPKARLFALENFRERIAKK